MPFLKSGIRKNSETSPKSQCRKENNRMTTKEPSKTTSVRFTVESFLYKEAMSLEVHLQPKRSGV